MYALLNIIGFVNIGALLFFLIRVLGYTANRTSKMTFDREAAAEYEKKSKAELPVCWRMCTYLDCTCCTDAILLIEI